jgi:ferric-dicitrate binding protein FerR (iron transport regulator)
MIQKLDIEKLERFSKGLSDKTEAQYISSFFSENEDNSEFENHLQIKFDEYIKNNPDEDYNLSYLLDRIHHIIHKNENKKKQTVVRRIYSWYTAAAAVLLIPILIFGGIWFFNKNPETLSIAESPSIYTLFAPMGSRISFTLPDGTQGWLNSGSSLEYSLPFNANRKVVVLGEANFNVTHDVSHPFEITAGKSKVKVLGTKFNLSAYPTENRVEVVLEEGKVEFSTEGLSSAIQLLPNERLILSNGSINIDKTEAGKYSAWTEGKLVFRGDLMAEVARRIERWYNVEVELVDKDLEKYIIRGTFQDDSLEDVFRYLGMTSPIRYRITDRKMLADGTWQKQKVLLYKK